MKKQVILLNGPSSSGKSTLSRALKDALGAQANQHFTVISIDDFMKLATDETIYEDDVFEISGEMCRAVLRDLQTADGVIVDHVITSARIFDQFIEMLGSSPILAVHVHCPLEVLLARENARGNRCPGSAEASYEYLYPKEGYDLTVNTHAMRAEECAAQIVRALK